MERAPIFLLAAKGQQDKEIAATGIREASVRRVWRSHGLKPHRVESFKVSNHPGQPSAKDIAAGKERDRAIGPNVGPWGDRHRYLSPYQLRSITTSNGYFTIVTWQSIPPTLLK